MKYLKKFTPASRLAFSSMLLVLSILSVAMLLGLVPDGTSERLDARARISEALTLQLATAASRNESDLIQSTLNAIEKRDPEILSIGLRNAKNEILAATPDHAKFWAEAETERSTQTHIRIPINDGQAAWGEVEIAYAPISNGLSVLGISGNQLWLALFMGASCFAGIYTVLRLALRELDPSRSVPTRVQSAFDSLSDGVAVIDEKDNILLVNRSLAEILGSPVSTFVGKCLSNLLWRHWSREDQSSEFPWITALRENRNVRDVAINLRTNSGAIVNMLVNASCITDNEGRATGALVTLKDVTVLERKNRDLSMAYKRLQDSESEIKKQNNQLKYLASHDPLTSCMNRRSLFEEFEQKLENAVSTGNPIACLMIDIDHFKSVNDTYGHATGDDVIAGLAELLSKTCRPDDIVGRYGGEEFCMVLDGVDRDVAIRTAERLRQTVKQKSGSWLRRDKSLSISIGIMVTHGEMDSVGAIVDHADQALYVAKRTGRDRAVVWDENLDTDNPSAQLTTAISSPVDDPAEETAFHEDNGAVEAFRERLNKSIRQSKRDNRAVAVICVSIDSQAQFLAAYGEARAADIMKSVEERLNAIFRDADTVSLMSGTERTVSLASLEESRFLIELTHIDDSTSVGWILQRLATRLAVPLDNGSAVGQHIRFSVGASIYPHDGASEDDLIRNAVLAQKKALETGGDRAYRMFSGDMCDAMDEQLLIEKGIRQAIERNEFHLYFQPIVSMRAGQVAGAEVLLRSSNEDLKRSSIEAVIQVAERTGLIHELSNYVFRTAFSIMNSWMKAGIVLPLVSINVSAEQFKSKDIVYSLLKLVEEHGIEPTSIQLELTETAMVTDIERTSDILRTLQSYGFHIALDDFGTGQSSLSHLLEINPDTVKIDKSFVQSMTQNHTNEILVTTITELAKKIGSKVVAEGVETPEQLERLVKIGCECVQGYLFSAPVPAEIFKDWLMIFSAERNRMEEEAKAASLSIA